MTNAQPATLGGMPIGERLREAREAAGMTQADASAAVGVRRAAWTHWEADRRRPDPEQIVAICRALNCSSDWLLGLSDKRPKRR